MIHPWWRRREDLDSEIQSLMGSSEFIVYDDEPHSCLHIMRGDEEFSSCLYPLDDAIRDNLRQSSYLLNNALDADERQRVKEANEKIDIYHKNIKKEVEQAWHDKSVWQYEHLFMDKSVTPMIISPGVPK